MKLSYLFVMLIAWPTLAADCESYSYGLTHQTIYSVAKEFQNRMFDVTFPQGSPLGPRVWLKFDGMNDAVIMSGDQVALRLHREKPEYSSWRGWLNGKKLDIMMAHDTESGWFPAFRYDGSALDAKIKEDMGE